MSDSKPSLRKLCHLVFWAERVFQDIDSSMEWRTLALDEVLRSFTPWVQQLFILRARGVASDDYPEGLDVAKHLMPLYYLLQLPPVMDVVLSAVDMVVVAVPQQTLDVRLAERCQVSFQTVLEVISFVDRVTPVNKDRIMTLLSEYCQYQLVDQLALYPAAERRERLSRMVSATRQVLKDAEVKHAVCQASARSSTETMFALGAAAKSCLKDQNAEDDDCDFWSASSGDIDEFGMKQTTSVSSLSKHHGEMSGVCPMLESLGHTKGKHQLEPRLDKDSVDKSVDSPVEHPSDVGQLALGKDARSKRDALWECVRSTPLSSCKFADHKAMLHAVQSRDYNSLLDFKGDIYPDGIEKIICSGGGIVAPITIQWRKQAREHFSGMFRCADFGLVRFSSVTEPHVASAWSPYPALLPMVALKLFRDGNATSANVVLARQKSGQKESNFLAHAISNHFTENVAFPFKAVLQLFKRYSEFPTFTGLSEFASMSQSGQVEDKVRSPYALVLFAPERQRTREVVPGRPLIEQLSTMQAGDLLYEVYAIPEPVDSRRLKKPKKGVWTGARIEDCPTPKAVWRIGDVRLTAPFTTSDFGDKKLFFQHHLFEAELRWRPDWRSKVDTLIGAPEYQTLIDSGDLWDPPLQS